MEMEVVLGIGEEVKSKACSSQVGSATQQQDSGEKTLGDDSSSQENGVRVSENGEPKVLCESKVNVVEMENLNGSGVVVETKSLNGSGVIEDCVMNGVSSLLKLKNEEEKEIDEDGEEEDDEEEEEEHGYYVGDFVWGKIKNHPWWPGQIYDPSDASELALKIKQKGKLLVAYFGDGTFAWCGPLQLKPFAESFKECSKVSNSRSFLGAVEEAVEEMGRHIERSLICDCAHKFDSPEAKNAGIKEGVVVHDVRRDMISSLLVGKPGEILEDVKGFAETVSFSGLLELEILKRKVSAFYRSKRGYGLSKYHEPQSVPGLEDKNKDDEDEKVDDGVKWPRGGAKRSGKEEEEKEEEEVLDPEESLQRSLGKCSGFPDHRLHHRRKQKSIAEILDNESTAKVSFETEPADGNVKSGRKKVKRGDEGSELENVTTTTPKSRRVSEISAIEDAGQKKVEDNEKGKTLSRKKKKNNADDKDDDESGDREESADGEETEKNEVSDVDIDMDTTPLASLRKRVRVDASSVEKTAGDGDTAILSSKRERKKSKYFSPDFLSDFSWKGRKKSKNESESSKISSQSQVGEQVTDASDSLMAEKEDKLDIPCEPALDNGLGQQELSEELSNAVDFLRLGASPKEMQDLIRVAALGTQYPKDSSSRDMVREFMSIYRSFTYDDGANKKFLGSYNSSDKEKEELNETGKAETKGEERKEKKLKAKQQTEETEQIGKEENETEKHGTRKKERKQKKPKSKKQGDEEEETLKESSASAKKERKQKKPKSKKQGDEEEETLKESSASAKKERKQKKPKSKKQGDEEEETLKESSASAKKERKRKKPESKKQADEEEETRKESSETTKKERKRKKRESKEQADDEEETLKELSETTKKERKRKKPQNEEEKTLNETEKPEKKKKKKREGKSKKQKVDNEKTETEKAFSGAELFVTFGPGSSLPKKEELIEIYEKFGALDEERTYMSLNNFCARVAFLNITDGEKAFESSTVKCPFTCTSTVKFRLKYPNERTEEKKAEVAEKTVEMEYVKKKLEEMRLLVDECEGGMSEEVKVKLEDEMVNLLEQVREMKSC